MKKFLKVLSVILSAAALLSVFVISPGAVVTNDEIKAKQKEISGLQTLLKEQKAASDSAKKRIGEIKDNIEKTEELKNELIEKIASLENEITTTERLISGYEDYIALKEEEIRQTEEELRSQEDALVEFLRYDYESGSSSLKTIEFLLDSASLSDFLSNIHYIGTLMDYQAHLIQQLETTSTKHEGQLYALNVGKAEKE